MIDFNERLTNYLKSAMEAGDEPDGMSFIKSVNVHSRHEGSLGAVWINYISALPEKQKIIKLRHWKQQRVERREYWRARKQEEETASSHNAYIGDIQQRVNRDKRLVADLNEAEIEQIVARKVQAVKQATGSSSASTAPPGDVSAPSVLKNIIATGAKRAREANGKEKLTNILSTTTTTTSGLVRVSDPDQERPTKKVAFSDDVFSSEGGSDYVDSNPSSTRSSLNSIDFKYIDHLVGPGSTSSRLNTTSRLIVGETNVSEVAMNARRNILKKQSEIEDESDLLTINFIFDVEFLRKHLPATISESLFNVIVPIPTTSEMMLLMEFSIFAATHPYQEARRYLRKKIQSSEECVVAAVLLQCSERPGLWKQVSSYPASLSSMRQNEDTYTQNVVKSIIFGIVGDLDIVDHWSRDPLPTPHGFEELYFPDYFAEFDNLPLFVVEIKKPDAVDDNLEGDKRKVACMMKLVLDTILSAGVSVPSVLGLQVRDSRCEVSTISLDNEALYIHRIIGVFDLPKNNMQLGLLGPAIGPLKFARDLVVKTINSITAHHGDKGKNDRWRRPSYYVKGNRIPIPKETTEQEDVTENQTQRS